MEQHGAEFVLRRVAVIGVGYIGSRIAAELALLNVPTVIHDSHQPPERAVNAVRNALLSARRFIGASSSLPEGSSPEQLIEKALHKVTAVGSLALAVDNVDLVIDAVVDDLEVKREVYAQVLAFANPSRTVLSTNTINLPLDQLTGFAAGMAFLSLRWLDPVLFIPFLEVEAVDTPHLRVKSNNNSNPGPEQQQQQQQPAAAVGFDLDQVVAEVARKLGKIIFEAPRTGRSSGWDRLRLKPLEAERHLARYSRVRDYSPILQALPGPVPAALDTPSNECVVCVEFPCDALLMECGHRVLCMACAAKLRDSGLPCPVCRARLFRNPLKAQV